jgi:hypothetical protein
MPYSIEDGRLLKGGTKMSKLRELTQLLPASILPLAMLYITLDIAASLEPSTKIPSAVMEISRYPAMPGQPVENVVLVSDTSGNKIARLKDQ